MAENFKTDFFTDRIGRGIQDIFQAQLDIATKRIYQKGRERRKVQGTGEIIQGRSGALMAALQNPNYSVIPDGESYYQLGDTVISPLPGYEETR